MLIDFSSTRQFFYNICFLHTQALWVYFPRAILNASFAKIFAVPCFASFDVQWQGESRQKAWTHEAKTSLPCYMQPVSWQASVIFATSGSGSNFLRICFLDNRRQVLSGKASNTFSTKTKLLSSSAQSCHGSHRLNLEIRIDKTNAIAITTALISVVVTMFWFPLCFTEIPNNAQMTTRP